jgi:hypothetical protein
LNTRGILVTGGLVATVVLAGCSSGSSKSSGSSSATPPSTTTRLASVLPGGDGDTSAKPAPPKSSLPSPAPSSTGRVRTAPSTSGRKSSGRTSTPSAKVREITKACPYISNDDEQIAEGKKVGRSTVLTTTPVGCRFYLAYPDYHAVAQITVRTFPTELAAFNTVARTGGSTAQSTPGIGDGAVLYRTRFYKPDGARDWACIFAKGTKVVTVHTDAYMSSVDARNVASAIVGRF